MKKWNPLKILFGLFLGIGLVLLITGLVIFFGFGDSLGKATTNNGAELDFAAKYIVLITLGLIGVIFSLIGGIGTFVIMKKQKGIRYAKEHGIAIYAKITGIERNYNIRVNGRHPFQVMCQYVDHATMTIYNFASEYLWYDPSNMIEAEEIRVYVDPVDYKCYYMDLDSVLPAYTVKNMS